MTSFAIFLSLLRIPFDFLAVFLAALLAYFLRPFNDFIPFIDIPFPKENLISFDSYFQFSIFIGFFFVFILFSQKLYIIGTRESLFSEFAKLCMSSFILILSIVSFYALIATETFFSRGVLLLIFVLSIIFSFSFRVILRKIEYYIFKKGFGLRRIALIGKEFMRKNIESELRCNSYYCVKYQTDTFNTIDIPVKDLDEIWFVKTEGDDYGREILEYAQINHVLYRLIPDVSGTLHAKVEEITIGKYPLLAIHPTSLEGYGRMFKRLFDIVSSLFLLILLFPVFCMIAFGIKYYSPGPIFYVSERVGRKGRHFDMYKFRSMIVNAENLKEDLAHKNERKDSPLFKVKNDPRITPFGQFLRRYSLDELPQMFNVLLGNMSLVGPRAHLPNEVEQYSLDQKRVLMIKPGITGMAQIHGRSNLSFEEEIRLDLHYIVHWSLTLDIQIILKTPLVLLKGEGAD